MESINKKLWDKGKGGMMRKEIEKIILNNSEVRDDLISELHNRDITNILDQICSLFIEELKDLKKNHKGVDGIIYPHEVDALIERLGECSSTSEH